MERNTFGMTSSGQFQPYTVKNSVLQFTEIFQNASQIGVFCVPGSVNICTTHSNSCQNSNICMDVINYLYIIWLKFEENSLMCTIPTFNVYTYCKFGSFTYSKLGSKVRSAYRKNSHTDAKFDFYLYEQMMLAISSS